MDNQFKRNQSKSKSGFTLISIICSVIVGLAAFSNDIVDIVNQFNPSLLQKLEVGQTHSSDTVTPASTNTTSSVNTPTAIPDQAILAVTSEPISLPLPVDPSLPSLNSGNLPQTNLSAPGSSNSLLPPTMLSANPSTQTKLEPGAFNNSRLLGGRQNDFILPTVIPRASVVAQISPIDGAVYIYILGGEFIMGSSDEQIDYAYQLCAAYRKDCKRSWFQNEQPQSLIYLDDYWIMQTEVTNAQYRLFVEAGGYDKRTYWSSDGWKWRKENNVKSPDKYWQDENFNDPNQPIVDISWYEAEAYTKWLSTMSGADFSLPTEAEWEKAARSTQGWTFSWGTFWEDGPVNYCDQNCTLDWSDRSRNDGYIHTAPVGTYVTDINPYGMRDMGGNVWEWTLDWYSGDYYANLSVRNPIGPKSGRGRTIRGGSWTNYPHDVRTTTRLIYSATERNYDIGFRVKLSSENSLFFVPDVPKDTP